MMFQNHAVYCIISFLYIIGYNCNSYSSLGDGWYTYHCTIHINLHTIITDSFSTSYTRAGVCERVRERVSEEVFCVFARLCVVL